MPPKPELCWETLAGRQGCMMFWFWGFFCLVSFILFSYKSPMASELASISVSTLITAFFFFKCLQSGKLVSAKDSK